MYHSSSSVFTTNKTPSGTRKHHESKVPNQELAKRPKVLSSSSSFFRWASSTLREPLMLVYTRSSSLLYGAVHNPIAFFTNSKSHKALVTTHSTLWLPVWDAIFIVINLYTCTPKDHLATKQNYYSKLLN